jgi:hypothetical protein
MIENHIVNAQQVPAEKLIAFDQMMNVRPRIFLTGGAIALGIEGLVGKFVHGAAQL